jgi:hypothetical protein
VQVRPSWMAHQHPETVSDLFHEYDQINDTDHDKDRFSLATWEAISLPII